MYIVHVVNEIIYNFYNGDLSVALLPILSLKKPKFLFNLLSVGLTLNAFNTYFLPTSLSFV